MVVAYGALLGLVAQLTAPLGVVGGLLLWLVMMACLPATLALGAAVVAVAALPGGPFGIVGDAGAGVLLYFMMIVRGLLFLELASSSRRAREFRRRMAG